MDKNEFMDRLREIQRVLGSTDREFAARLGISHAYWVMVRTGKRRVGQKLLVGVIQGFPELEDDAMELLRQL